MIRTFLSIVTIQLEMLSPIQKWNLIFKISLPVVELLGENPIRSRIKYSLTES